MHELTIVDNVLKTTIETAKKHGANRLTLIRLKVGQMTHLEPESVRFYLDLMAKGTIAEGVRLEIDRVTLAARCKDCGHQFAVSEFSFVCPGCGGGHTEVVSGRELYIDCIEVE